ncbi:phosphatidylethanolamine-binding protein [Sphingomonas sp. Leaf407]|uniref:YbhB/YbcL family Raf kinase inhibitor-like protein n=1 Tax=unclassified Sphingomonas TaxID=196159 RepID=UPI0006F77C5E|nr:MULTISPECIES: YbhB/YbcL family Raf kinase inhibitor-like protein [unclassified Sphingomonas]KQN39249.1 phosphatidylethanolamine-binding protein [Sphingomonas sp. Leaf42]KQT28525.1 phosphatidylethanolamine-binding protein [Sphingomonas sp. Leaf407]
MLEHVPAWLGALLRGVRAGASKLTIVDPALGSFDSLDLSSLAFADGQRLPERFTADGEGLSPPLHWRGVPAGTRRLALIVEDPDAPAPQPLVHAILWDLPPEDEQLPEGDIRPDGDGEAGHGDVGRNSYLREGWLPPDPPTGHGEHRYAFQLFALGDGPDLDPNPGRSALVEAMAGRVLAAGLLTGTYSRGEPADVGPVGAPAPV